MKAKGREDIRCKACGKPGCWVLEGERWCSSCMPKGAIDRYLEHRSPMERVLFRRTLGRRGNENV